MGQSNSPSENYLFLNVMVNFVIVNQKLTDSALHIEKNRTITPPNTRLTNEVSDIDKGYIFGTEPWNICDYQIGCQLCDI